MVADTVRRLTLLWLCCWLLPARGDDLPLAAITAAAERETTLKSLTVAWKVTAFMPKGGRMDADLFGLPLPRADITVESTHRLVLDGNRYRVEHNDLGMRQQVPAHADGIEAFDGDRYYSRLYLDGRDRPPTFIIDRTGGLGGPTIGPILLWCRGREREPFALTGKRQVVVLPPLPDDSMLTIRVDAESGDRTIYFLDSVREYVCDHTRLDSSGTTQTTKIEYRQDRELGWVPSDWTITKTRAGDRLVSRITATVTDLRANEPVDESLFRLKPEPGDHVADRIARKEFTVGPDGTLNEFDPSAGPVVAPQPARHEVPGGLIRWAVRYGIVPALAIGLVALIVLRRRRGRSHTPSA